MRLSLRDIEKLTGVNHGLVRRILKRYNILMIPFDNARTYAGKKEILDMSSNSGSLVTTFFTRLELV